MVDNGSQENGSGISRRKVLAATGATGVLFTAPSIVGASGNNSVRVPKYKKSPNEVTEWMEVPKKWHNHHKKAKKVLTRFNKEQGMSKRSRNNGVHETGLVAAEESVDGKRGFKIEVLAEKRKHDEIPDSKEGIAIDKKASDGNYEPLCENTGTFDPVLGGVNIFDSNYSNPGFGDPLSTSGYPVEYNGTRHLVAAAHSFADCAVNQGDDTYTVDDRVGSISMGSVALDYVVTDTDSVTCENSILSGGNKYTPTEYASESEVGNRVSSPFDGHTAMGCTTGETTGGLGKKNVQLGNCHTLDYEGVRCSADSASGDSGGPWFDKKNNGSDAIIISHTSQGLAKHEKGSTYVNCRDRYVTLYNKTYGPGAYYMFQDGLSII